MKPRKEIKMIDPPRYPNVTVPIDNSFKKKGKRMLQSIYSMIKVEVYDKP